MSCIDGGVLEALSFAYSPDISTEEEAEVDVDVEVKMEVEAGMDMDVPMGRRFLHITSGLDEGGGNTAFEHLIRLVPKP
ncbi:MAG: hypothetical protein M1824_001173 [Vezdaea acicularis]|nr:MAG: hypothetical protein M1824_001173 [Vezdaea acicularis]